MASKCGGTSSALYVALAGGAALWIVTMAATGRSEAWDIALVLGCHLPVVHFMLLPAVAAARLRRWKDA
jgi:hypothetical protein